MKTFAIVVAAAIAGFVLAAAIAFGAVGLLSSNTHDRSVEAAVTAFLLAGPLGALLAAIAAAAAARRRRRVPKP